MKKIRILIADDHAVMRMGLNALFDTVGEFEVVGEAADGAEAVEMTVRRKPDVVIMDLVMPVMDGVSATGEIMKRAPNAHVLLLTTYGSSDGIAHALDAGPSGAVLKSASNENLISAIKDVAAGRTSIANDIRRMMQDDPPIKPLTPRQTEILSYVMRGLTNQDIAKATGIRVDSVGQNLTTIFNKLGAANRAEAITIALRKQLLKL
ncbi:MAG: response regulator transcription factor [Kiritimatiellae bacterium]|nr:response regulator transcription factor [Kiritimatiellia bacterium]